MLAKQSRLFSGDIVLTEKDGAINLRFNDGGKIGLRTNTRFAIEAYTRCSVETD